MRRAVKSRKEERTEEERTKPGGTEIEARGQHSFHALGEPLYDIHLAWRRGSSRANKWSKITWPAWQGSEAEEILKNSERHIFRLVTCVGCWTQCVDSLAFVLRCYVNTRGDNGPTVDRHIGNIRIRWCITCVTSYMGQPPYFMENADLFIPSGQQISLTGQSWSRDAQLNRETHNFGPSYLGMHRFLISYLNQELSWFFSKQNIVYFKCFLEAVLWHS